MKKTNPAPVALITGAARRIGAAIARELHAAGCRTVIHYNQSADEAGALADVLNRERRDSAAVLHADLLDDPHLAELIEGAVKCWGRLDVLINNASSFFPTPVGAIDEYQWQDLVGTNFKAPLFLSQAAAPHLKAAGGCIVNMADIHIERPMQGHVVYTAAKSALVSLTRSLARELAPEVRVNAVAPGAVLWPEDGLTEQAKAAIIGQIPLGRRGEPGEVARAVRFLALEAAYITGHVLAVDGGRNLYL